MNEEKFTVHSSAFESSKSIPTKYANAGIAGGKNVSLPLQWENPPQGTKSFLVAIVDLHPIAHSWVHWIVADIPANERMLHEGASMTVKMPANALELFNSFGVHGYGGPQPPRNSGQHKYEVTVYALSVSKLHLKPHASLANVLSAIDGFVLATAKTYGVFERN